MKGKNRFSELEASKIRQLLAEKVASGNDGRYRAKLRAMEFYCSDFPRVPGGLSPGDFDQLMASGEILIV